MKTPSGGDGLSLPISAYVKNTYGARDSVIVAKTELLLAKTKNSGNSAHEASKCIALKSKEISFGGEDNTSGLFQLLNIYESFLPLKFQEPTGNLH